MEVVWRGATHRTATPDSLSPLPDNADNAAADTCVQPLPRVCTYHRKSRTIRYLFCNVEGTVKKLRETDCIVQISGSMFVYKYNTILEKSFRLFQKIGKKQKTLDMKHEKINVCLKVNKPITVDSFAKHVIYESDLKMCDIIISFEFELGLMKVSISCTVLHIRFKNKQIDIPETRDFKN